MEERGRGPGTAGGAEARASFIFVTTQCFGATMSPLSATSPRTRHRKTTKHWCSCAQQDPFSTLRRLRYTQPHQECSIVSSDAAPPFTPALASLGRTWAGLEEVLMATAANRQQGWIWVGSDEHEIFLKVEGRA